MIPHFKLATGVSSARFWGLILKVVYTQEVVIFPSDVDTAELPPTTVPKFVFDDWTNLPMVARIHNSMLKLVNSSNQLLNKYQASMDIPSKVTCKVDGDSTKASKGNKKKKQYVISMEVEEEVVKERVPTKIGKCVLKKTKKAASKK